MLVAIGTNMEAGAYNRISRERFADTISGSAPCSWGLLLEAILLLPGSTPRF